MGSPLAYLIAPPIESMYTVDAAVKAAEVELTKLFGPPSETNFGGAQLTGTQSACKAACDAFAGPRYGSRPVSQAVLGSTRCAHRETSTRRD